MHITPGYLGGAALVSNISAKAQQHATPSSVGSNLSYSGHSASIKKKTKKEASKNTTGPSPQAHIPLDLQEKTHRVIQLQMQDNLDNNAMLSQDSRFAELGNIIQNRTREIQQFLSSQGSPCPSLAEDAGADLPLPQALQRSRNEILEACTELQALAEGPKMHLTRLSSPTVRKPLHARVIVPNRWQMNIMMSIQAIYRYEIASKLSLNERVSFNELAKRCDIDEQDLTRLMRLAIANHIFIEPQKGIIGHSAISRLLATDPLLHSWIGLVCEEMWPPQHRVVEAMQKWPGSEEPQHTAYCLANPGMTSYFQAMESDPGRNRRFAEGMKYLQSAPGFAVEHLFNDLGWDGAQTPNVMVDIGGSLGSIAIQLLRKFPSLKCEVQDLAETVAPAQVPVDLEGRLDFRAHNFFTEQPRRDADVYFMRSILHDWSDKYALNILRSIVPALKHGARIIINEVCLPEPNSLPFYHAQLLLGYDMAMKMNFNSRERDADGWAALLRLADPRLQIRRITCSPGSILSVIEVCWEDLQK